MAKQKGVQSASTSRQTPGSKSCSLIAAIDPGTTHSALVTWDNVKVRQQYYEDNNIILLILQDLPVTILVVEKIVTYGQVPSTSIFETVFWTGRFCQLWTSLPSPRHFYQVTRRQTREHILGTGRTKSADAMIRAALIDRFGEPRHQEESRDSSGNVIYKKSGNNKGEPKMVSAVNPVYGKLGGDLWQAFAVAVTWVDQNKE